MITVRFSRRPDQGAPSGFDLGDIEISGPTMSVSSAGKLPDHGMMIFLSAGLLLDQLRQLLSSGKGTVTFCGVDSSFRVRFTAAKGTVAVSGAQGEVGKVPIPEFISSLLAAADAFASSELVGIPEDDPARSDLVDAIAAFRLLSR